MSLFPSPIAQPYPPPKPKSASNRRTIILILVLSGIAILAVGGYALYRAGSWYSRRYLNIDQSQATFVAGDAESVYRNPAYGVALRLPGRWVQAQAPIANYCALQQPNNGAYATFRVQFSSPQQTLDQLAGVTMFGLVKGARFKLVGQDSLDVNGQAARRMIFEYALSGVDGKPSRMVMLMMKRGYNAYTVMIFAPLAGDDYWKELVDSLDRAVEIK